MAGDFVMAWHAALGPFVCIALYEVSRPKYSLHTIHPPCHQIAINLLSFHPPQLFGECDANRRLICLP